MYQSRGWSLFEDLIVNLNQNRLSDEKLIFEKNLSSSVAFLYRGSLVIKIGSTELSFQFRWESWAKFGMTPMHTNTPCNNNEEKSCATRCAFSDSSAAWQLKKHMRRDIEKEREKKAQGQDWTL